MSTRLRQVTRVLLSCLLVTLLSGPSPSEAVPAREHERGRGRVEVVVHPVGDSITYGATNATFSTPGGYRAALGRRLSGAGIEARFVGTSTENAPARRDPARFAHDGWNGRRIEEMTASLAAPTDLGGGSWLVATPTRGPLDSDVTVIMAGVNDIYQRFDPAHPGAAAMASYDPEAFRLFVDDAARRLHQLVRSVHRLDPGTSVVLCTNVPIEDYNSTMGPPIDAAANVALNRLIRGRLIAELQRQGVRVVLADVERDFRARTRPGTDLIDDGVHPTPQGYGILGRTVARAVVELTEDADAGRPQTTYAGR